MRALGPSRISLPCLDSCEFINFWKFYVQFTLFCSIFTTLFQVTISPCPNYCSSHFICLYVSIHPPHSSIQELSKCKGKVQTLWSDLFVLTWLHPLSLLNVWKKVKVTQSCPTLCDPMDCIVYGILQSRILVLDFPFSRGSSQPKDQTQVSCIVGRFFTSRTTREAQLYVYSSRIQAQRMCILRYTHPRSQPYSATCRSPQETAAYKASTHASSDWIVLSTPIFPSHSDLPWGFILNAKLSMILSSTPLWTSFDEP